MNYKIIKSIERNGKRLLLVRRNGAYQVIFSHETLFESSPIFLSFGPATSQFDKTLEDLKFFE